MTRASRSGFSLVEVLIASALLAALIAMTMAMLLATSKSVTEGNQISTVEETAVSELRKITRDLTYGDNTELSPDGQNMAFQIPIDHDGDGDVLDATDAVEFGYYLKGATDPAPAPLNWSVAYEWVPVRFGPDGIIATADDIAVTLGTSYSGADRKLGTGDDLPAAPLVEALDDVDYNRDGDRIDTFVRGRIDQVVYDNTPAQVALGLATAKARFVGREGVLQEEVGIPGRLDADALDDPIFARTGNDVIIRIFVVGTTERGGAIVREAFDRITLRNENVVP